jgi:sulfite reductase (ferredoxin)
MAIKISENVSEEIVKDIYELDSKIQSFINGEMPEDKFKHFRLTRGIYGQRQIGVQMFRIKLPAGRVSPKQFVRIAEIAQEYGSANLHVTTRQDIQLHYIKVTDAPVIWAKLGDVDVNSREACGNTVRNITASATAGVDKKEVFDVSSYAYEAYRFLLRNPICQDMGRKIKLAYSSSEEDTAFTFLHDFGFIPRIVDGERGFKVVVGGGLGAQAILAQTAYEFLHEDQMIPFLEAGLRVFDRYGERTRRNKARMKYLIKDIGLEKFMELIELERLTLKAKSFKVDRNIISSGEAPEKIEAPQVVIDNENDYQDWLRTNVFEQKQEGFFGVYLKITNGDIKVPEAIRIAEMVEKYASQDMRCTMNQGMLIKFVRPEYLPYVYSELKDMGFARPGFDSIADVTTCPGTDTCNLGVTNSMTLAKILEDVIHNEYRHLIFDSEIKIKMSGCMNSCGQHMAAQIGFHGSSIKVGQLVAPSMQVVLGGGVDNKGVGTVGDKIVKLPTKRITTAVRNLLDDYEEFSNEGEYFNDYYQRQGKPYFYTLLKPLADTKLYTDDDFFDYGQDEHFVPEIGVGECAGVMYDMVGIILKDAEDKKNLAYELIEEGKFPEAIYHAYGGFVIGAKAILLSNDIECNTQIKIMKDFDEKMVQQGHFTFENTTFEETVLDIQNHEPDLEFAKKYLSTFESFLSKVISFRKSAIESDKIVVEAAYKA